MESAKLSFDSLEEIACLLLHIFGECSLRIKTDKMLSWKDENRRHTSIIPKEKGKEWNKPNKQTNKETQIKINNFK